MTHRTELIDLQQQARRAGRVCNFFVGPDGIEGVFYQGRYTDCLSFAERERAKPKWYQQHGPNDH